MYYRRQKTLVARLIKEKAPHYIKSDWQLPSIIMFFQWVNTLKRFNPSNYGRRLNRDLFMICNCFQRKKFKFRTKTKLERGNFSSPREMLFQHFSPMYCDKLA